MATTEYGVNATKRDVNIPSKKIAPGEVNGSVLFAYDTFTSVGAVTISSVIKMMKLPAGARMIDAMVKATDFGTAGDFDIGWEANGVEVADPNGMFAALDANAAAQNTLMSNAVVPGVFQKFSAETQISISLPEASTAIGTVQLGIWYVVD